MHHTKQTDTGKSSEDIGSKICLFYTTYEILSRMSVSDVSGRTPVGVEQSVLLA